MLLAVVCFAKEKKIVSMNYINLCGSGLYLGPSQEILDKVNELIKNGYVPYQLACRENTCIQSFVKYEEQSEQKSN
jgi:hypothetical protein